MSREVSRIGVAAAKARLNNDEVELLRLLRELHRVADVERTPNYQLHLVRDEGPDSEGGETE
jgi:hypothetical protein